MSGSEFSTIRRRSQAGTRITSLVRAFQNYVSTQFQLDKPDFKAVNRPVLSRLKYHDKHIFTASRNMNLLYYSPLEPDGDIVVGLWKLDHNGRYAADASGFANHMTIIGNPRLKKGIDIAGLGGSLYMVFDDNNRCYIADKPKLNSTSYRNGFSLTARIYPFDISDSDVSAGGLRYRHIVSKHDDTTGDNGYAMAVTPDGHVVFTIWRNGTGLSVTTAAGVIVVNTTTDPITSYDLAVTVSMDGRGIPTAAKLYVNNVGYTTITTSHLPLMEGDTLKALRVGALFPYNDDIQKPWYKWKGGIQDFRIYREKVLSDTEVSNYYTNKITIRNIAYGQAALAGVGVWSTQVSLLGGFSSRGFSPVGFHTQTAPEPPAIPPSVSFTWTSFTTESFT